MTTVYSPPGGSFNLPPLLSPAPATDPASLLTLQAPPTAPTSDNLSVVTSPLNIPPGIMSRLRSFPEEVYTLLPTDNLTKLLKVLLGDAGAGQLRKFATLARMGTYLQGANFYDLDQFYGAIFNITRSVNEQLPVNPYTDLATADTWSSIKGYDASFRSRIDQLGKAISFGPSAIGMELVAEAILQCPCSIYESWRLADIDAGSWGALETFDWSAFEGLTWSEVEALSASDTESFTNRRVFTVVPHRPITPEEDFAVRKVLNILKPADAVLLIDDSGFSSASPVTLRGVYADSEYWELIEGVIPNPAFTDFYSLDSNVLPGGFREVLRPSFTEYEGEQITYGGDIIGVSAYDQDSEGNITADQVIGSYTFQDGTTLYYPPSLAIAPRFFSLSGRYVSDAILQGAPYSNDPSQASTGTDNPLMDLYVDGIPIDSLITALNTPGTVNALGINAPDQRFWTTLPRLNTDPTVEVLDISLVAARLVNNLTFAVAHYPQTVQVQTFNPSTGYWGTIWSQTIYDSLPSVLSIADTVEHQNPQHPAENWDTFTLNIPPTVMSEIRILLQRIPQGRPPVTAQIAQGITNGAPTIVTTPVPYSLGIQDFALGYNVSQESDLPAEPITTTDALGSQVQFIPRFEVAENAINGGTVPWRSSPQPTADSVVNFYVDTRDITGKAQLINQIFLDPLYLGPHCTVYFSDQSTADLGFPAEATNILPPNLIVPPNDYLYPVGVVTPFNGALVFDSLRPSAIAVENLPIQFDPAEAWWFSVQFRPNFPSYSAAGQILADLGNGMALGLDVVDGIGELALTYDDYDDTLTVPNLSWSAGQTLVATVAYFPETTPEFAAGLYLFYNGNNPTIIEAANLSEGRIVQPTVWPIFSSRFATGGWSTVLPGAVLADYLPPTQIWFGDTQTDLGQPAANLSIVGMVLKQTALQYSDLNNFPNNTNAYTTVGGAETDNAILYWNYLNINDANAYGFVGGPGDFYELLTWTPIMRDYVLTKGFLEFPPVSAAFFKLEFTNLVAQQLPTLFPITKTAKQHFGLGGAVQETPIPTSGNPGTSIQGTDSAIDLASEIYFEDSNVAVSPVTDQSPTTIQPTSVQTAQDIETQAQLANSAWFWQYQEFAVGSTAPRFVLSTVHNYNETTVVQTGQVSYFVGLNSVAIYRLNPSAEDDTIIYDEPFLDDAYIYTANLPQIPGDVNTGDSDDLPLYDQSSPYNSSTPVYGVQFATVQSDPVQIAWDDDFSDPAIRPPYNWSGSTGPVDSEGPPVEQPFHYQPSVVGNAFLQYQPNQTVLVDRDTMSAPFPSPSFDGIVQPIPYPIFEESITVPEVVGLTPDIATYDSQPGTTSPGYLGPGINMGGLANAQATTPMGGVVYAAVRLSTNDELATPLFLEIVDVNTQTIVAQLEVNCAPNQTVEAYVGYVLGSQVEAGGPVISRIVQYGGANNSWIVDRLSTFLDAWVWEFSVDGGSNWVTAVGVRNNAYGIITFPDAGTELVWRVTGWAQGLHLHWLRVRPVYNGVLADEPLGVIQGPNQGVFDQTPPINQDPYFAGWSKPIPYWWYQASADYAILPAPGTPQLGPYSNLYIRDETETLDFSDSATQSRTLLRQTEDNLELSTSEGGTKFVSEDLEVSTAATYEINPPGAPLVVGSGPIDASITPDGTKVYVVNSVDATLSVVDAGDDTVAATITVGTPSESYPNFVAINHAGTRAYVCNSNDGTVAVVNTSTEAVVTTITGMTYPNAAVLKSDDSLLYVAGFDEVWVIDTSTNTIQSNFSINPGSGDYYSYSMAITSDDSTLYVGGSSTVTPQNLIVVVDIESSSISSTQNVLNQVSEVALTTDESALWIVVFPSVAPLVGIVIMDTSTFDQTSLDYGPGASSEPAGIQMSSDGTYAYVVDGAITSLYQITIHSQDVTDTFTVGPGSANFCLSPDNSKAYVPSYNDNTLWTVAV